MTDHTPKPVRSLSDVHDDAIQLNGVVMALDMLLQTLDGMTGKPAYSVTVLSGIACDLAHKIAGDLDSYEMRAAKAGGAREHLEA